MKFYEFINNYDLDDIDIYFDMDGVLAEYDIGNFDYNTIRPLQSIIKKFEDLAKKNVNIKILTVCNEDKIIDEKIIWLNKYLPFFDVKNAIFLSREGIKISSEELKSNYLKSNCNDKKITILIDDDIRIIKCVLKNNENVKVFHISSLID